MLSWVVSRGGIYTGTISRPQLILHHLYYRRLQYAVLHETVPRIPLCTTIPVLGLDLYSTKLNSRHVCYVVYPTVLGPIELFIVTTIVLEIATEVVLRSRDGNIPSWLG